MNPGLTMVVGPPGTGKTDVAVQIVSNIYHNNPDQRTLLVTHSNQALNDLFEKIMERDVHERHLLRLGRGQEELATTKDFSKWGRVNMTLARRVALLEEVRRLAATVGAAGDVAGTCENATNFYKHTVVSAIEAYEAEVGLRASGLEATDEGAGAEKDVAKLREQFPFKTFFSNAPGGLDEIFKGSSWDEQAEAVRGCFRHLHSMFEEIGEYRAFELLRTQRQRSDYILTKQARIVAMTCTHAALIRRTLVGLGFKYDNIVMEESAQILEVETFIPMLLQTHDMVEGCRLKRVTLIGDHNQLPPVVKNMAFQKYGRLDQSLFARFVRLGVPTTQLNLQGRARPDIARLYTWRYDGLGHLPATSAETLPDGSPSPYALANAGMRFPFQFIDVPDFMGNGESAPSPHFYQNLGEAEFMVATFQYLRLVGYPANRITLLTTYNGQKHLLQDIVRARCTPFPQFGDPADIETVDRYQGQQNDIVLLSLVRTRHVGHLRDVRRLVVATSRARLGLYVFGRQSLFQGCYELRPTFDQLLNRPTTLQLVPGERLPTLARRAEEDVEAGSVTTVEDATAMGVLVQGMVATHTTDEVEMRAT
jgi:intron-binding protein aquarius